MRRARGSYANRHTSLLRVFATKEPRLLLTLVFCGFPLGQSVVGYMAAFIVANLRLVWLLIVGGIAALALIPVIAAVLPSIP